MNIIDKLLMVDYLKLFIPLFLFIVFLEAILTLKKAKTYYRLPDAINSLSCGTLSRFTEILLGGNIVLLYAFIERKWGVVNFSLMPASYALLCAVLVLVYMDFTYYWFHRASHHVNILWAGHIVHHSSEDFNYTTAIRQSAFEPIFAPFFYLPLAFLGWPVAWYVSIHSLSLVFQFWVHTRHIDKMPAWFESIFNTPSHHRVHHGRNPKYLDKNFSGTFIIWDKLFGTFQAEEEKAVFGITTGLTNLNPLWAQIHYFYELFQRSWCAPGIYKILFWFKSPAWLPSWENHVTENFSTAYQ